MKTLSGWLFMGLLALTCALAAHQMTPSAQAAASGTVEMCEKIATTGPIDFWYCQTDYGDFFTNSMGFMVLED